VRKELGGSLDDRLADAELDLGLLRADALKTKPSAQDQPGGIAGAAGGAGGPLLPGSPGGIGGLVTFSAAAATAAFASGGVQGGPQARMAADIREQKRMQKEQIALQKQHLEEDIKLVAEMNKFNTRMAYR
jgi:hypothetical protein